jgi:hypothetical protein
VTVGDLTGKNVTAFQFSLYYNKNIVIVTDASTQSLMTSGAQVFFYADTLNGLINCAWASASPLAGSGDIVKLKFKFIQFGYSALTCVNPQNSNNTFLFNNGTPAATVNAGSVDVPLPIELNSFSFENNKNTISLKWETITEVNSSKFIIERAIPKEDNFSSWKPVGEVKAAGNSNSPRKYSYTDKDLISANYQYRLKMIDNNGVFKYSSIMEIEVAAPKEFELVQNYPNPFNPSTKIEYTLQISGHVKLQIISLTGQIVKTLVDENQYAGYYSVIFSGKNLSSGMYLYRLSVNNKNIVKKMLYLK